MQIAAFMPMVRGYYNDTYLDKDGKRQKTDPSEFWNFKNQDYQIAQTSAIAQRLPFTRYIYSQLYYAYRVGAAVVKPMFYDYPEDNQAFNSPEQTYMLGDSIKVSPVLDQGVKEGD
jgi:alpha-glucosidase (family GH31 glycosyl hydrolase)